MPEHGVRYRIELPACKMPDRSHRLPAADAELLLELISGRLECVYHRLFDDARAGDRLFGGDMEPAEGASRFPPAAVTNDNETLFLRFNLARHRVMELAESPGSRGRLTMAGARALLAWHRRALEARDALAKENQALVLSMVKRHKPAVLDYDDAVSDGNVALVSSICGFDCSRAQFSTYACRAIRKSMSRGASVAGRRRAMFPTEFDPALERGDADDPRREEALADGAEEVGDILRENRAGLNERELRVIRERFYGPDRLTLEQVGRGMGVTKERVRQIQAAALAKIRSEYMETL